MDGRTMHQDMARQTTVNKALFTVNNLRFFLVFLNVTRDTHGRALAVFCVDALVWPCLPSRAFVCSACSKGTPRLFCLTFTGPVLFLVSNIE